MSRPVTLHGDALAEFDEAYDWFESRWTDSGDKFAAAVRSVFERIGANPKMHSIVIDNVRRALVPGHRYYVVYYRERVDDIEVLSIFHTSRDPKEWQERI